MRVRVYPADSGGCGWARLRWPAALLEDVTVDDQDTLRCAWDRNPDRDPSAHVVDVEPPDADVCVFQRPLRRTIVEAMACLQRRGIAVVVEVDDDHHTVHPSNPAYLAFHPAQNPHSNRNWLALACRNADLVTVSTPALAERYGRHGRVAVLPNCVPASYLSIQATRTPVTLGYHGSPETHPGDLAVAAMAVQTVVREGARFRSIGGRRTCDILGVEGEAIPWLPLLDGYPQAVASLDVGIAPVVLSRFNACKSWIKTLELAALGVACVASPSVEYLRAEREGMCVTADRPRTWLRELRRLMNDAERAERAGRAREAASRWTYEQHADRWMISWRQALEYRTVAA